MTTEPHVVINGKTFLYRQKAPFVPSGVSVLGALEYDPEEDKVRCHECGKWFESVGTHLQHGHPGLTAIEYRQRHGLRCGTALVGERVRTNHIRRGQAQAERLRSYAGKERFRAAANAPRSRRMEFRNARGSCPAQVIFRVQQIAAMLGHVPTAKELREHGVSDRSATLALNCKTIHEVLSLAGLQVPEERRKKNYSRATLIEMLRDFQVEHGRLPSPSDQRRGLIPHRATFRRAFGSWKTALETAGFGDMYHSRNSYREESCA